MLGPGLRWGILQAALLWQHSLKPCRLPSPNISGNLLTALSLFQVATAQQQEVGEVLARRRGRQPGGVPTWEEGSWQLCAEPGGRQPWWGCRAALASAQLALTSVLLSLSLAGHSRSSFQTGKRAQLRLLPSCPLCLWATSLLQPCPISLVQ